MGIGSAIDLYRDRPKPTRSWIRKNAEIRAKLNSCESSYRTQSLKLARAQFRGDQ